MVARSRINTSFRILKAAWLWAWQDPPHLCWRHSMDIANRRYGYHDYGNAICPRCNVGNPTYQLLQS